MQDSDIANWHRAIGPNADRYMRAFDRLARKGGGWVPGWNTAAFFHSTGWLCYRRMYGFAIANLFGPLFLSCGLVLISTLVMPHGNLDLPFLVLIGTYGVVVFIVVPVFADSLYYRSLRKRLERATGGDQSDKTTACAPSAWTKLGAWALGAVWILLIGAATSPMSGDYTPRAKVAEALLAASQMRNAIEEFYQNEKRLPTSEEAKKFRSGPEHSVGRISSLVYDGNAPMIVITMRDPLPGKKFALHVVIRDTTLVWTCRTIDLDKKYLPTECRN